MIAKTFTSLVECVHMTGKNNVFIEHFLKHLVHRQSNYAAGTSGKKVILYWGIIKAYTVQPLSSTDQNKIIKNEREK